MKWSDTFTIEESLKLVEGLIAIKRNCCLPDGMTELINKTELFIFRQLGEGSK